MIKNFYFLKKMKIQIQIHPILCTIFILTIVITIFIVESYYLKVILIIIKMITDFILQRIRKNSFHINVKIISYSICRKVKDLKRLMKRHKFDTVTKVFREASSNGNLDRIIEKKYDPMRINKKDKEFILKYAGEAFSANGNLPQGLVKKALKKIEFPKYKPAYQSFIVMENGWLLVIADAIPNDYALIDIFNQEGKYIAQFETSVPIERLFFRNNRAYAVATEDDYKFVKRYNFEIQEYKN